MKFLNDGGTIRNFYLDGGFAVHDKNDTPVKGVHCSFSIFDFLLKEGKIQFSHKLSHGFPYYADRTKSTVYKAKSQVSI